METGWMGGWVDGWMEGKAGLRIAYSNQKFPLAIFFFAEGLTHGTFTNLLDL